MFFGNILLDKKGPYSILWKAAHGVTKSIARNEIKKFNAAKLCDSLVGSIPDAVERVDSKQKFSLYLISHLLFGTVIIVKKQGEILLADVEAFRASFLGTSRKRKRASCNNQLTLDETSKRKKHSKDAESAGLLEASFDVLMEELDQAFLNNRVEVARLEDITLKEVDLLLNEDEQFSDAITDFGERSTFRDHIGLETMPVSANGGNLESSAEKTSRQKILDQATKSNDRRRQEYGNPILLIPTNEEASQTRRLASTVRFLNEKKSEKLGPKKAIGTIRGAFFHEITTVPLDEYRKRAESGNFNIRAKKCLFDWPKVHPFTSMLDDHFQTTFANNFSDEERFPKAKPPKPLTLDEALNEIIQDSNAKKDFFLTSDANRNADEVTEKEQARHTASSLLKKSATKSVTRLGEGLKISSCPSIAESDGVKVSEPLPNIWLEKYFEEWSHFPKSSHLLQDFQCGVTSSSEGEQDIRNVIPPCEAILPADLPVQNLVEPVDNISVAEITAKKKSALPVKETSVCSAVSGTERIYVYACTTSATDTLEQVL